MMQLMCIVPLKETKSKWQHGIFFYNVIPPSEWQHEIPFLW